MSFMGNTIVTGAKFEVKVSVGSWFTLIENAVAVSMKGDNLLEKDYHIGTFLLRWHKEWTLAANMDSQFSVGRTSSIAVHVDMNNKLTGRVSIKAKNSEHLRIAQLRISSVAMYFWNRVHPCADPYYD
ncbi:hypothetical protein QYE76_060333 [Lolium multiflorum]|uniref:Translocase of chloroplast 159/132 membrane anchor domain-containing protein n=1 Tax=Lolium multiflorum TaxID=4521 RepID=A0AAD8W460_LOLMU|nr:hypothetical protein QYE76_060333 [Lolium multiflorum]